MDEKPTTLDKAAQRAEWIYAAAAYLALAFLMAITVFSSDDYWYSTFMDGGLHKYLELMKYHYETFNGRVLVHVAAQFILHFGTWMFAIVGTAVCLWIPFGTAKAAGAERGQVLPVMLVFVLGVLAMQREILVQGVLWISAFCNYVLPTAMVCGEILLLHHALNAGKNSPLVWLGCAAVGLACGATTEQSGFVSVCVGLFYCLVCLVRNFRRLPGPLLSSAAGLVGVLTIFRSPATQQRLEEETAVDAASETMFESISDGFEEQVRILSDSVEVSLLLALLFVAAGVALWRRTGRRSLMACFAVPAAVVLITPFAPESAHTGLYLAVFILMALCALALVWAGRGVEGLLMLAAVGSVCVLLPTDSTGGRVLTPFYLYTLMAASALTGDALGRIKPAARLAVLSAAVLAIAVFRAPLFGGCWYNFRIDQVNKQNAEAAKQTGTLYYCMDYDMDYTHFKAFTDGYFYSKYLESEGLDEDIPVYMYSLNMPEVYVDGHITTSPALPAKDEGHRLLPLRSIIESLGGIVKWNNGPITVTLRGREYHMSDLSEDECSITWTDYYGEHSYTAERSERYFETCVEDSVFADVFGLDLSYDGDHNVIYVQFAS